MYDLSGHGQMLADSIRMDAYVKALRSVVGPDTVLIDLGTGTGVFALVACQCGARKVYAIEVGNVIQVAREIAEANGFATRIEFVQEASTRVSLPERGDVILSDLRGVLPLFRDHIPSIIDARERLLARGGILIPQRDDLWAAVVEAPELYRGVTGPWDVAPYGLDMEAARRMVVHAWRKARASPEQMLVEPQRWAALDYTTLESADVKGTVTWSVERAGTGHGFVLWFDATLVEGCGFSNAPGAPGLIYESAFFPWPEPVSLAEGDTVSVSLEANLVIEDYVWCSDTVVRDKGGSWTKAKFHQSTFLGVPLAPAEMRKREASFFPVPNTRCEIDRYVMNLMDGRAPLGDIAKKVARQFPDSFPTAEHALIRVSKLSLKYSQ